MSRFFDVSVGRLAYEVHGPAEGALVVGVHGMGDTRASFRFLAPRLVSMGYRVAAVDVRGHGESSTHWPDHSQQSVGADLVAFIRHLGGPAILVGNSSGAGAAAFAAASAPDQVSSLILVSTFASKPELNPLLRAVQGLVLRSPLLWGMYFRSLFTTTKPDDLDRYVRTLRTVLRQPGRMTAVRELIAPGNAVWTDVASQIHCPVLIVHGTKDPDYPDSEAEARVAQQLLASAEPVTVTMIEGAGHYPHVEMPDAVVWALRQFLATAHA